MVSCALYAIDWLIKNIKKYNINYLLLLLSLLLVRIENFGMISYKINIVQALEFTDVSCFTFTV